MEKGNVGDQAQSLSSKDEPNSSAIDDYSAQDVADAFVKQYYNILQESPEDAHKFYKDTSILDHPCPDGSMKSATTLKDIDNELKGSNIKEWNPNLTTVHAQDSVVGSVIVGVTGFLTDNDNVTKHFAQTFCLATQEGGGFYVHNDFLQFIEINNISETSPPNLDVTTPIVAPQAIDKEKGSPKKDENKVASSSKAKNPLPTEPNKKSESVNIQEEAKRVSYASIVAKEGPVASSSAQALPNADRQSLALTNTNTIPKQSVKPLTLPSNDVLESMYDVKSIRIKDLPSHMTEESLQEVVKRFGPVKNKNIQIKEYSQDGYRYAFVEFESPKSARTAVEARFIQFEDRESEIQYKRYNSNQGGGGYSNYMGGRGTGTGTGRGGGFRSDNFWGAREGHVQGGYSSSSSSGSGNWGRRNRYSQDQSRSFN
ncbi:nuclear transport factor 2 [Lactuca sativa]|nr:nuclear transport factor 2 [Lactuca sativa]